MSGQEHVPSVEAVERKTPVDSLVTYRPVCSCGWQGALIRGMKKSTAEVAALEHSKQARGVKALTQTRRSR